MKIMPVPVNEPLLDGNEKKYLESCITDGWISSEGPFVGRFEKGMAELCGRRFAVAVANGTLALDAAVVALGIGEGDEVIMPTFTIISCAAAVVRAGAVPIFVDSDPRTWNMDVAKLEGAITSKTKAIMVVHIYGLPVDMDPLLEVARRHNLKIIEDAAEMHGQTYKGKPCGSFGELSTFSFYPNKHITTGEGGMILADDPELHERCASLRNLCFAPPRRFVHHELGWNMRMTNIQAALGVAQLERVAKFVEKKRWIGDLYRKLLGDLSCFEFQPAETPYAKNINWVFGMVLKDSVPFDADEAQRRLGEHKIGTRPFFWPMHEQPVLRRMVAKSCEGSFPVAERIARRGFYVPSGLALSEEQIRHVSDVMHEVFGSFV